jgi:glycosyltransferase involved in cell wall biosynthesis
MRFSIIIPARNEELNLPKIIEFLSEQSNIHEVIICEGNSKDETWRVARELEQKFPSKVQALQQDGNNKFNAVLRALEATSRDQIVIWDADGTVAFADQMLLLDSATDDPNSLWTGDRLRGRREKDAMRFLNFLGNHFFATLWGLILRNKVDTLCGTKIFNKRILDFCPPELKHRDPFGDFSLIAGAYLAGVQVRSIPVHYLARSYGETNIRRWSNGLRLLQLFWIFLRCLMRERSQKQI